MHKRSTRPKQGIQWLSLVPAALFLTDTPPPPTTPTPTPGVLEVCFSDGLSKCFLIVWEEYGLLGLVILVILGAFIFLVLTPAGQLLQDKIKAWLLSLIPQKKLTPEEQQALEEIYLHDIIDSPALSTREDPAVLIANYLKNLKEKAHPLHPIEEATFVPLETGLALELQPTVGLAVPAETGPNKGVYTETHKYKDLSEAMGANDPTTGKPYPAFALLGLPGSGKSTLLRKLAREAVQRRLTDPTAPIPLFISLSTHRSSTPHGFLRQYWRDMLGYDGFDDALDRGSIWLFADGLNEMGRRGYRQRVAQWRDFINRELTPRGNRAIIACRDADYGDGLSLPRLNVHHMDERRIQEFLKKRTPEWADRLWHELEQDRDLYALATIPFWLVMMTGVAGAEGLPRNRALLVFNFIEKLLDYETSRRGSNYRLSQPEREAFKAGLTRLAWRGLPKSDNFTFSKRAACKTLTGRNEQADLQPEVLLDLARDCRLLQSQNKGIRFQHQLFQEYFAGRELARRFKAGKNLSRLWQVPWRKWRFVRSRWDPLPPPPQTGWEEATVLAAGLLETAQVERLALQVMRWNPPLAARCLLETGRTVTETTYQAVVAAQRLQINNRRQRLPAQIAAGKALGRLGDERILRHQHTFTRSDGTCFTFIEPDWAAVPAGDFQMGSTARDRQASPDEKPAHTVRLTHAFKIGRFPVTVTEYDCFMQAGGYENELYWQSDAAQRWLRGEIVFEESYHYYLFQLIQAQSADFLRQVDRWEKEGSWSPAQAHAARQSAGMSKEQYQSQWEELEAAKRDRSRHACRPWLWDEPRYTTPNQPAVGICWYEASAYCVWLEDTLQQAGRLEAGLHVRLPSEAEWEKAARGEDGRRHPWGKRWAVGRANTLEGRVLITSPVGVYPQGASPWGALDMAGNIWEWCNDWYDEKEYQRRGSAPVVNPTGPNTGNMRVVRGGSWGGDRYGARCAYRRRGRPDSFNSDLGFRLVLSPK